MLSDRPDTVEREIGRWLARFVPAFLRLQKQAEIDQCPGLLTVSIAGRHRDYFFAISCVMSLNKSYITQVSPP